MERLQFPVLYREFLFRTVDLEVLSQQGDIRKLLGQFAALLIFVGSVFGVQGMFFDPRNKPLSMAIAFIWRIEHFLLATTMLAVGLFVVLSWDSMFPDRRDVLVLAPLPVRPRTLFLAKAAALASALGLTVAALNMCSGVFWPAHFIFPRSGFIETLRAFAAYWITAVAAGTFVFCSLLTLQGLAAQLPRRQFLAVSSLLQMSAFCLLVSVYFLQPALASPAAIGAAKNQAALAKLPSYWFFGLFHLLKGSMPAAMAPLAHRALVGLAVAIAGAGTAFLVSYFRTMRKIIEEPDIVPGARGIHWLPPFGSPAITAIVHFAIRTLARSRQHRVILAFYLGVGFGLVAMYLQAELAQRDFSRQVNSPMLAASIVMLCFWIAGTRVVFAMPIGLRANWIFRITAVRAVAEYAAASRRALVVIAVAPAIGLSAAAFLGVWPAQAALAHVVALAILGMTLAEAALRGFRKIPFTCSYLPGKSQAHMVFLVGFGLLFVAHWVADMEFYALRSIRGYAALLAVLAGAWAAVRWHGAEEPSPIEFEDEPVATILALGLTKDGVPPRAVSN